MQADRKRESTQRSLRKRRERFRLADKCADCGSPAKGFFRCRDCRMDQYDNKKKTRKDAK